MAKRKGEEVAGPVAARLARVDDVCGELVADLAAAPRTVREMLHEPGRTVEALRTASPGCP